MSLTKQIGNDGLRILLVVLDMNDNSRYGYFSLYMLAQSTLLLARQPSSPSPFYNVLSMKSLPTAIVSSP